MNELAGEQPASMRRRSSARSRARDREIDNAFTKDAQVTAIRGARNYLGDKLIRVAKPHRLLDPASGPLIAVRLSILTRKTLGGLADRPVRARAQGRRLARSATCSRPARWRASAAAACTATARSRARSSAAASSRAASPAAPLRRPRDGMDMLRTAAIAALIRWLALCPASAEEVEASGTPAVWRTVFKRPDGPAPAPADNPLTPDKIALGGRLFLDTRLSGNGERSCATCHRPERAFTDGRRRAAGISGSPLRRNTPAL